METFMKYATVKVSIFLYSNDGTFKPNSTLQQPSQLANLQLEFGCFFLSYQLECNLVEIFYSQLAILVIISIWKRKRVASYNHGHKIMKHLKILVQVPFATSKVVYDIYYKKHCTRVVSRFAERLKTHDLRKLGNIGNTIKMVGGRALYPVFLPQTKIWYQWSKITQKRISKFSCPVQFYLISWHCFINFVHDCSQLASAAWQQLGS